MWTGIVYQPGMWLVLNYATQCFICICMQKFVVFVLSQLIERKISASVFHLTASYQWEAQGFIL